MAPTEKSKRPFGQRPLNKIANQALTVNRRETTAKAYSTIV
jgi:hypothetical protein